MVPTHGPRLQENSYDMIFCWRTNLRRCLNESVRPSETKSEQTAEIEAGRKSVLAIHLFVGSEESKLDFCSLLLLLVVVPLVSWFIMVLQEKVFVSILNLHEKRHVPEWSIIRRMINKYFSAIYFSINCKNIGVNISTATATSRFCLQRSMQNALRTIQPSFQSSLGKSQFLVLVMSDDHKRHWQGLRRLSRR